MSNTQKVSPEFQSHEIFMVLLGFYLAYFPLEHNVPHHNYAFVLIDFGNQSLNYTF